MSALDTSPDPTVCPLCGQGNACAAELERSTGQAQPPCWCMEERIGADVLAQVPADARGLACVCQRCAAMGREKASD
ncbi:MAG: hypothetical protein JWP29_3305 [Rhodoferax sp.]|nr:hypothetical protein [Rhodoferax sp.]